MNKDRVALVESFVRLSFIVIFLFALTVASYGLVSICQMFMHGELPTSEFVTRDLS